MGAHADVMIACAAHVDMLRAWMHVVGMGRMVQIRNVPENIHRKLKERAARAGMSLSDYILLELRKSAEVPTLEEMKVRLANLPPVKSAGSTVHSIRQERDNRDREIERRIRGRR